MPQFNFYHTIIGYYSVRIFRMNGDPAEKMGGKKSHENIIPFGSFDLCKIDNPVVLYSCSSIVLLLNKKWLFCNKVAKNYSS